MCARKYNLKIIFFKSKMLGTLTHPAPPQAIKGGPRTPEVSVRTQAQGGEKGIGVGGFTLPRPTGVCTQEHTDLII